MAIAETKFVLTIPKDIAAKAEELKNNFFNEKPYAEIYHYLIQIGINEFQQNVEKKKQRKRNF